MISPFDHPVLGGLLGDEEMAAALGFEAELAAMAAFEVALAEAEAGQEGDETGVVMLFVVEGPGLGAYADAVDAVMRGQHERLLRLIETGSPTARPD